ncbi:MAG: peptidoglycan-binding domain-containing protein [Oscillospiraceae bacterium]|nr:peptidoglycan-binding domain-containing protein [Oscillospiraceae bacterium]
MMRVLVYDTLSQVFETYDLEPASPMPYVPEGTLTVEEFWGGSRSSLLWTSREFLEAYRRFRSMANQPLNISGAFRRIWEGGYANQSYHYAGLALDFGRGLSSGELSRLAGLAQAAGLWNQVFIVPNSGDAIHAARYYDEPASLYAGYPSLSRGSRGNYVLVLQDGLNYLGYYTGDVDGIFGEETENAVRRFQKNTGLSQDGAAGARTWAALTNMVLGAQDTH